MEDTSAASVLQAEGSSSDAAVTAILNRDPGSGRKTGPSFRDWSSPEDACWCPESRDGGIMEGEKGKKGCRRSQHGWDGFGLILAHLVPPLRLQVIKRARGKKVLERFMLMSDIC